MLDPAIIETIKIIGHIVLPAILTIGMLRMRVHPVMCMVIAFCLISSKELADFHALGQIMEYDDLLINFCGSALGCVIKAG